jgi:hypothetical protein
MKRPIATGVVALAMALAPITAAVTAPAAAASAVTLPTYATIVNATKLAAQYYRTTYAHTTVTPQNGWSWSTYTQGVQALFEQAGDQHYVNDTLTWGQSNAWGVTIQELDPMRSTQSRPTTT